MVSGFREMKSPLFKLMILLGVLLCSGCASKAAKVSGPVFFPPPPDPPRIQFLMGFGDSRDVEEDKTELSLFSLKEMAPDAVKFLTKPYGVAAHGTTIYVADTLAGKVSVIDLEKKSFNFLKGDFGPGKLKKPVNVATDSDGNLFVADTVLKLVLMYDADGNFLRSFGNGLEIKPVDMAADEKRLFLLDFDHSEIKIFNKASGELMDTIGQASTVPEEKLALPTNMALNAQGTIYVSNVGSGRMIKLDRDGHVLGVFGRLGTGYGQFGRPRGVATDEQGRFYVVDAAHQNVQIFDQEGRLLLFFGNPGLPEGSLNIPAGIEVHNERLDFFQTLAEPDFILENVIIVTNQVDRNKVAIYGLGKKKGVDYEKFYRETLEERKAKDAQTSKDNGKEKKAN